MSASLLTETSLEEEQRREVNNNTSKENDTMEKKTETAATTEKDPEPSVSKRSRNKEPKTTSTVYTSVKCYLSSIIKSESSRSNVTSTKERFEERCKSVSKMMVKGSLFLRLVVDECLRRYNHLEDEIDKWPDMTKDNFYVQLLRKGLDKKKLKEGSTHPVVEDVWNSPIVQETFLSQQGEGNNPIKRHLMDFNTITYAAKQLKTCFETNLRTHFRTRQQRAISGWLAENGFDKKYTKLVQHWIIGCTYKSDWVDSGDLERVKEGTKNFVTLHRKHLCVISDKKNGTISYSPEEKYPIPSILNYYKFLQTEYPQNKKIQKMIVVPKHKLKIHYCTFDQTTIQGICKDLGVWKDMEERHKQSEDILYKQGWYLLFDVKKIKKLRPNWNFHSIQTDGEGVSVLFSREVEEVETVSKKSKKNKKPRGDEDRRNYPPTNAKYVVGVDPGRTNVVSCSVFDTRQKRVVRKHRMTAKQYYQESWMTDRRKANETYKKNNKEYKEALEEITRYDNGEEIINDGNGDTSTPTKKFEAYLKVVNEHYRLLWNEKGKKKYRKNAMKVYSRKQKCISNFIDELIPKRDKIEDYHIAFGDAKFACTGRGEQYASPARIFAKKIKERVGGDKRFTFVDEKYTSKVCHRCNQPLNMLEKDCFSPNKKRKPPTIVTTTTTTTTEEDEENGKWKKATPLRENRDTRRCSSEKTQFGYSSNRKVSTGDISMETPVPSSTSSSFCTPTSITCVLGGKFVDRDFNASTNIVHKFLGFWDKKLMEKKDKMPLKYHFIRVA
ncbi:hypothetical protein SWSSV_gp165 [White spot syndrome virus]|uniref:Wsv486 n=4 Tax=White spot syndrome virus TaxID=342409 RepID=Q8VAD9_WSSVS|nr:wsv486 [Shrimp white spot syndrome virus]YP_009220639.1 hypothetical protein SWSSV_gp165 [White spot syndrome virus]AAL33487.1 wsv486 [Shrimp white spot syndrome virus]AAL88881.1 WSSV013 [Shrimp white spot syndrome virus]ALN66608.1 hypothetical protein [White spot syndrome virus]ASV62795.1 hypothetical protein [White spot syndrome virus]AWU58848.1 putative transposase DNA-binding domain-containing protein [White spot syndrome virus]